LEGLALLGLDESGALYWDGQRVELRGRLDLMWWQKIGAFLVSASIEIAAAATVAQAVIAWLAPRETLR
jgi:hypothetical protein